MSEIILSLLILFVGISSISLVVVGIKIMRANPHTWENIQHLRSLANLANKGSVAAQALCAEEPGITKRFISRKGRLDARYEVSWMAIEKIFSQ